MQTQSNLNRRQAIVCNTLFLALYFNTQIMEFTIKIDPRKKEEKALIAYLKNLPFVEIALKKKAL